MQGFKLSLRQIGPKGRGVFTEETIPEGAEILHFLGELKDVSELSDLTHCLQVDERTFLSSTGGIDDYINHSCSPNCGVRLSTENRVILFALEAISADAELTFDYATTQSGNHEVLNCACGSEQCRALVSGFEALPSERQIYFVEKNAVLPFLVAKT